MSWTSIVLLGFAVCMGGILSVAVIYGIWLLLRDHTDEHPITYIPLDVLMSKGDHHEHDKINEHLHQ